MREVTIKMGSFNTTCFASNQTIASGDKCRIVPITQQSTFRPVELTFGGKSIQANGIAHTTCYANCFWQPQSGFITAEYDDYGRFELQLDPLMRSNLLRFYSKVLMSSPKVSLGENESHDLPFDFESFLETKAPGIKAFLTLRGKAAATASVEGLDSEIKACWEYISEVAQEHRLFLVVHGRVLPLQFAAMHERTYEALVAQAASDTGWDGELRDPNIFIRRSLAEAAKESGEFTAEQNSIEIAKGMQPFLFADIFRRKVKDIRSESGSANMIDSGMLIKLCSELLVGALTEDDFVKTFLPVLNDRYAALTLDSLNLKYSPMVYAGQDYDNSIGQDYAKLVSDVSKKITRDRKTVTYGEYLPYQMTVPTYAALDSFRKFICEYDSDIDDINAVPVTQTLVPGESSAALAVTFASPSSLKELRKVLKDAKGSELMIRTLEARPEIAPMATSASAASPVPAEQAPAAPAKRRSRP